MKNAPLIVLTIVGTLLASGCGANHKAEENAFVPVTGHDLEQLSQRISSLESKMRETQMLLVRAQKERNELSNRLQAIEARFPTTAAGARPSASKPDPGTATPHRGNNEKP
jgi:outer membrane murein-binding lipoprotein Lpp